MALEADRAIVATMKCLIPKNGFWVKRISVLSCFILLDYLVTVICCTMPAQEGNLLAGSFTEAHGISLGLTLFDAIADLPIYVTLCIDSHLISPRDRPRLSKFLLMPFLHGLSRGFISMAQPVGSGLLRLVRQALGASLYLIIVFPWYRRKNATKPR